MNPRSSMVEARIFLSATPFCEEANPQGAGVPTNQNTSQFSIDLNIHNLIRVWRNNIPSFYKLVLIQCPYTRKKK